MTTGVSFCTASATVCKVPGPPSTATQTTGTFVEPANNQYKLYELHDVHVWPIYSYDADRIDSTQPNCTAKLGLLQQLTRGPCTAAA